MAKLDELIREIEEVKGTTNSAIQLIGELADKIAACGTDQAKLDELVASLNDSQEALAAAVALQEPIEPQPEDPVEDLEPVEDETED